MAATPSIAQAAAPALESTSDWLQVDAGDLHTCGIRTSHRMYCWGNDSFGQLGDGGLNEFKSTPVLVAGNVVDWLAVTVGDSHTCGLRMTGQLYCWGSDAHGKLGDGGTFRDRSTPVAVAGDITDWTSASAGGDHTCARRSTGRIYCWGSDSRGQVGDGGSNTDRSAPVLVAGGATNWGAVSTGLSHTCARKTTGRLYCWGNDLTGQLGNGGTNANATSPVPVAGSATTRWTLVAAGATHTCARRSNGRLFCWGSDAAGQLGDGGGPNSFESTPVQVAGRTTDWVAVAAGDFSTCARKSNGRLYCWGSDAVGQLGNGGANTSTRAPVQVAGRAIDWSTVAVGERHACARKTGRTLFCWGRDDFGQLGDGGANADRSSPVAVAG